MPSTEFEEGQQMALVNRRRFLTKRLQEIKEYLQVTPVQGEQRRAGFNKELECEEKRIRKEIEELCSS